MVFLLACVDPELPADLVVQGGTIHTLDAKDSEVSAVAVRDGVFVYVGDDAGAFVGPDTRLIEIKNGAAIPAFHDAHTHLIWSGADLLMVDVYAALTVAELQSTISAWAVAHPDEAWVQGGGWDTSTFYGSIDRTTLDAVVSDRPAYVYSADSHIGLANTLALAAAGITASTPDPFDGTIEHDANGEPTGILLEGAMSLVDSLIPPYSEATVDQGLKNALSEANGFGIISVVDANIDDWMLAGYARAEAAGTLTTRVFGAGAVEPGDAQAVSRISGWQTEYGSERISVNAAKLYLDGIIESETAYMLEPYESGGNGTPYFSDAELQRIATELDAAGLQLHAHAIGDAAVRQFFDAVVAVESTNGRRDRRPLAAHIEVIDPADIPRFAELEVLADFQAVWAWPDSYIRNLTQPVIGPERSEWLYPIGPVVEAGGTYVGGSDWSVTSQNPFEAIEAAVTRKNPYRDSDDVLTPDSVVSVRTALRAYTSEGAKASFSEEYTGTIELGKRADFLILNQNPFLVEPEALSQIKVLQTWFEGETVYERADHASAQRVRQRRVVANGACSSRHTP